MLGRSFALCTATSASPRSSGALDLDGEDALRRRGSRGRRRRSRSPLVSTSTSSLARSRAPRGGPGRSGPGSARAATGGSRGAAVIGRRGCASPRSVAYPVRCPAASFSATVGRWAIFATTERISDSTASRCSGVRPSRSRSRRASSLVDDLVEVLPQVAHDRPRPRGRAGRRGTARRRARRFAVASLERLAPIAEGLLDAFAAGRRCRSGERVASSSTSLATARGIPRSTISTRLTRRARSRSREDQRRRDLEGARPRARAGEMRRARVERVDDDPVVRRSRRRSDSARSTVRLSSVSRPRCVAAASSRLAHHAARHLAGAREPRRRRRPSSPPNSSIAAATAAWAKLVVPREIGGLGAHAPSRGDRALEELGRSRCRRSAPRREFEGAAQLAEDLELAGHDRLAVRPRR